MAGHASPPRRSYITLAPPVGGSIYKTDGRQKSSSLWCLHKILLQAGHLCTTYRTFQEHFHFCRSVKTSKDVIPAAGDSDHDSASQPARISPGSMARSRPTFYRSITLPKDGFRDEIKRASSSVLSCRPGSRTAPGRDANPASKLRPPTQEVSHGENRWLWIGCGVVWGW